MQATKKALSILTATLLVSAVSAQEIHRAGAVTTPRDIERAEAVLGGMDHVVGPQAVSDCTTCTILDAGVRTADLMVYAGRYLLGTPYVASTLEGGTKEELRIYLTKTDCILFAENCLGLVRTAQRFGADATFEDLAAQVVLSRYRDGVPDGYPSRLHYTSEWIERGVENGLFQDLTESPGGVRDPRPIRYMSEHPGSYAPLAGESPEAKENLRRIRAVEERLDACERHYIPKEKLSAAEDGIRSGDILCFATSIEGLDYSHVVIAYREKPGDRLGFIHASSAAGRVIVEPRTLEAYLQANRRILGVTVLRVNDD